ncbi:MAG: PHP domain-containing protein, partial [Clostridiales bacterium]|nr:PHP domain-containing protein [Clostridiales bacterium]
MEKIKHGIIHTHTSNSVKDSVLSPTNLVKRASELGAPAVVLSDHGVLTGVFEFMRTARETGIKGIPGVEAYIQEEDTTVFKRSHLLLIPMDYTGYMAISQAVTLSNSRLFKGTPCMNMMILKECFGYGVTSHGHVIATSACMGGILSKILLADRDLEKDLKILRKKQKDYHNPKDPGYLRMKQSLVDIKREIDTLCERRDALTKLANRKLSIKERALSKLSGNELAEAEKELIEQKKETENAKKILPNIQSSIVSKRKEETSIRQQCAALAKTHAQWYETRDLIAQVEAALKGDVSLYSEMKQKAKELREIFGEDNFYIELQNHGIPEEAYVMPLLANAADELCIPTVACNDVHYADNTPECVRARQIVQSLRFNKWNHLQTGDTEYYIKDDETLSGCLSEILSQQQVIKAMSGIGNIISRCDVCFPDEAHLPKFKGGAAGESASERLIRLANEGIPWRYPNPDDFTQTHRDRMAYELNIIEKLGFCDYLCIVQDFLNYGRKLGTKNPESVGLGVGPGRGSAVGSLVCYLIGITSLDPIRYGLLFERFLNEDRVSMPDIDSDFGMEIRNEVINYV